MDGEKDEGFGLILSLDGCSGDYVLGFEAGRLWEQLKQDHPFEQTFHAANMEIVMRMREVTGREMVVEDSEVEDWCYLVVGAHGLTARKLMKAKQLLLDSGYAPEDLESDLDV